MFGILIDIIASLFFLIFTIVKTVFELVIHLFVLVNPVAIIFNALSFVFSTLGWILFTLGDILLSIVNFVVAKIVPGLLELIAHILEALCLGIVYLIQFLNSVLIFISQSISIHVSSLSTNQLTSQPTPLAIHVPKHQITYQPINQCQRVQMLLRNISIQKNHKGQSINISDSENTGNQTMVSLILQFIQEYEYVLAFVLFILIVFILYRRGRRIQRRIGYQLRKKQKINQILVFSRFFRKIKQNIFKFIEKCRFREKKYQNNTALQTIMNSLVCPITCCPIKEPACLKCGHTFEKQPLRKYLRTDPSCPLCRKPSSVLEIFDNYVLKEIINTLN